MHLRAREIVFTLVFCVPQFASRSTECTSAEFGQLDLGDSRREPTSKHTDEKCVCDTDSELEQHGWGETMAAYRFFNNVAIDWQRQH
jgi:hypothetical protein